MTIKWGLLAVILMACGAPAETKEVAATDSPTTKTSPGAAPTLTVEEQIWLDTHNMARARYRRTPLVWDEALERDARIWARHMANTQEFEHSTVNDQGENLWMGTRAAFPSSDMVQSWVDEEAYLKSGKFPDVSTSGNWADVGHMTQLLWPSTTHVGCAKASSAADDFMVCRYSPPGNWTGEAFDARQK